MSNMFDQIPMGADMFADNPEPRCPCVLLLDTSASMSGPRLDELNEALRSFQDEIKGDSLASKRIEVAIVTFGSPVTIASDFVTADDFYAPFLTSSGNTPMGEGIETAINMINKRKDIYKSNGISYFRPWVFLITDGAPTDNYINAANLIKQAELSKNIVFFSVGVQGADLNVLSQISTTREPLTLKGLEFKKLFSWLSNSLSSVSRSTPGDVVPLEAPSGWANV